MAKKVIDVLIVSDVFVTTVLPIGGGLATCYMDGYHGLRVGVLFHLRLSESVSKPRGSLQRKRRIIAASYANRASLGYQTMMFLHMRVFDRRLICVFLFLIPSAAQGQPRERTQFSVTGRVLELDMPFDSRYFNVTWRTPDGKLHQQKRTAQRGRQLYEMRTHPNWKGIIDQLRINNQYRVPNESVISPSWQQEWLLFSRNHEQWMQSRTNFLDGTSLFGIHWHRLILCCISIFLLAGFLLFRKQRQYGKIMLTGVLLIVLCVSAKNISDLWWNMNHLNENDSLQRWNHTTEAICRLRPAIQGKTWSLKLPESRTRIYIVSYQLADLPGLDINMQSEVEIEWDGNQFVPTEFKDKK